MGGMTFYAFGGVDERWCCLSEAAVGKPDRI